jgi:Leucine rich repeat
MGGPRDHDTGRGRGGGDGDDNGDDGDDDKRCGDDGRDEKDDDENRPQKDCLPMVATSDEDKVAARTMRVRRISVQTEQGRAKAEEGYYDASMPRETASRQPTSDPTSWTAPSQVRSRWNAAAAVPPPPGHASNDQHDPALRKGAWRMSERRVRRLTLPSMRGRRSGQDSSQSDDDGSRGSADEDDDPDRHRPPEQSIAWTEGTLVEAIDLIDAEFDRSRRKRMVRIGSLVLLVVVVAIVAVAVGVTLSLRRNNAEPTVPPTLAPTFAPEAITAEMFDAFLSDRRLTNTTLAAMGVEGTPQSKALQCLQSKRANRSVIPDDNNPVQRLVQQYALAVLYYATTPPAGNGWTNSSGWLVDLDECEWFGCRCNRTGDGSWEMHSLDLSQNGLAAGTLPAEIGILDGLAALDLSGNAFSGTIPSELGRLSNLQVLALTNNTLTGVTPLQLYQATALTSLDLDNNLLRGSISSRVGQLTKLTALNVWANEELTGTLTELGLLTELKQLVVFSTRFTAAGLGCTIPRELGTMRELTSLTLSGYGFSGTIPEVLAQLTSLNSLVLTWNQLSGTLPTDLGSLRSLGGLDVSENAGLTGTVSEQLCTLIHDNNLNLCVTSTNTNCSEPCGCACACA